ncbi:hypothetical protein A4A49_08738, partial [Nicotiana attenuata]
MNATSYIMNITFILVAKTHENDEVDEGIGDKYNGDLRQLLNERRVLKKGENAAGDQLDASGNKDVTSVDAHVLNFPHANHAHDGSLVGNEASVSKNSVAADRVGKEASVSKNSAILNCPNATDGTAGFKNSKVVQQEVGTAVNAVVTVPVTAALNRVVKDMKAATTGFSKGPGAGQKSVEAGLQTSKGQGQVTADSHKEPAPQVVKLSTDQVWSVVNLSPSKTNSTDLKNQRLLAKNIEVSNSFAALVNEHDCAKNITVANSFGVLENELVLDDAGMGEQQADRDAPSNCSQPKTPGSAKNQQIVPIVDSKAVAATEATPMLHISDPHLAKMIKESHAAMLMHTTRKINAPLVTLNTSVHDVPSQSLESFGERHGESGQQLLSTGNNQQVEKSVAAISQANSTNKMLVSKEQQAVTSEFLLTRETWADRCEHEEDIDFENLGDSEEEADHGSYTSNEGAVEVHKEQVSSSSQRGQIKKGLSPNATVFVPAGQQQKLNNAAVSKEIEISSMHKAVATGSNNAMAAKYNLTPTSTLHALVSHDIDTSSLLQQQYHNTSTSGAISNVALVSDQDRALLDTLDSPKPHRCAYSTGSKTTSQKMKVSVAKRHEACSAKRMKRHEPLWMVIQEEANQKLEANLRVAIYDEAKEDELIEPCSEEAATSGDFSPKH